MEFILKNEKKYNKTVILLGIFSVLSGVVSAVFAHIGIAVMPITAGLYAALLTIEGCGKRIWTYVVPALIVIPDAILNSYYSFNCALSIVIAIFIFLFFRKGYSKTTLAVMVSIIATAAVVSYIMLGAYAATGKNTLESVVEYYGVIIDSVKDQFISYLLNSGIQGITTDYANTIFRAALVRCFAVPLIIGFVISGVSIKTFFSVVICTDADPKRFYNWRFGTTSIFAIAFLIVSIINWFTSTSDTAFAAVVGNLYLILLAVYAYLGFTFVRAIFARKFNAFLSNLFPILITLVLNVLAVQILSFLGMVMTIMGNRLMKKHMNDNNSDNESE